MHSFFPINLKHESKIRSHVRKKTRSNFSPFNDLQKEFAENQIKIVAKKEWISEICGLGTSPENSFLKKIIYDFIASVCLCLCLSVFYHQIKSWLFCPNFRSPILLGDSFTVHLFHYWNWHFRLKHFVRNVFFF